MIRFAVSFALVVSSLLTSQASLAASLHPEAYTNISTLTEISVDPDLHYAHLVKSGSVSVNPFRREAVLLLNLRSDCKPNQLCRPMLPPPIVIRATIVKSTVEKCNVATHIAQVDQRTTGGNLEVLKIVDNSKNMCLANAVSDQDLTTVTHKSVTSSLNGLVQTFTSKYYGTMLVPRAK